MRGEHEPKFPKSCRALLIAFGLLIGLLWVASYRYNKFLKESVGKTNAIQSIAGHLKTALMAYAADHHGQFPDAAHVPGNPAPLTSNAALRRLFEAGYLKDEKDFVVRQGAAKADGDTSAPEKILARGENHWALAKGLRSTSNPSLPLVWEAPLAGNWDPIWDSSRKREEWGSTWSDGSVIVMTVAGEVVIIRIAAGAPGEKGPGRLAPTQKRKNLFQLHPDGDSLGPEW